MLTVGTRRVDHAGVNACVERWATELAHRPEVVRVIWYGSFVSGTPTPRSDVDVCIVVRDDSPPARLPRHSRGAQYIPAAATPAPFDIAVLSTSEFESLAGWAPAWAAAIASGRTLIPR